MEAEQPELAALWAAQDKVLADQYIVTATEYGISRWEAILGIYPKDTDGLEMRRARILSMLQLKLPYTKRWLANWLNDLCGAGNYDLAITAYSIVIDLGYDLIPEAEKLAGDIYTMLAAVRPANMVLELNGMRNISGAANVAAITECALDMEVWPAQAELDSSGGVQITGYTEYVYTADAYPVA
nr:MAG TPA: tail protein [Caudoviricetes sp.]